MRIIVSAALALLLSSGSGRSQVPAPQPSQALPNQATKLEAAQPRPGAIYTAGVAGVGEVTFGATRIAIDIHSVSINRGVPIYGFALEVRESGKQNKSFVDADEIPDLIRGMDAVLEVQTNPTALTLFSLSYKTKGELVVSVYNQPSSPNQFSYSVSAGRFSPATRMNLSYPEMRALRDLFVTAAETIAAKGGTDH